MMSPLPWWALVIFVPAGIGLFFVAIRNTLANLEQPGILDLDPFPGRPGELLTGTVQLARQHRGRRLSHFMLRVLRWDRVLSNSRRRSSYQTRTLWEQKVDITQQASGPGGGVTFSFVLPSDLPSSFRAGGRNGIDWIVECHTEAESAKPIERFRIPVIDADAVSQDKNFLQRGIEARDVLLQAANKALERDTEIRLHETKLKVSKDLDAKGNEALQFSYPMFREPLRGAVIAIFAVFFGAISVWASMTPQPSVEIMVVFGLLALLFTPWAILVLFNGLEVLVSSAGVTIEHRLFGLRSAGLKHIPADDIVDFVSEATMVEGDHRKARANVRINIINQYGQRLVVGDCLINPATAEEVIKSMKQVLSMPAQR